MFTIDDIMPDMTLYKDLLKYRDECEELIRTFSVKDKQQFLYQQLAQIDDRINIDNLRQRMDQIEQEVVDTFNAFKRYDETVTRVLQSRNEQ